MMKNLDSKMSNCFIIGAGEEGRKGLTDVVLSVPAGVYTYAQVLDLERALKVDGEFTNQLLNPDDSLLSKLRRDWQTLATYNITPEEIERTLTGLMGRALLGMFLGRASYHPEFGDSSDIEKDSGFYYRPDWLDPKIAEKAKKRIRPEEIGVTLCDDHKKILERGRVREEDLEYLWDGKVLLDETYEIARVPYNMTHPCRFDFTGEKCGISSPERWTITNKKTSVLIHFSGLLPHHIRSHYFFDLDPKAIIEMLKLSTGTPALPVSNLALSLQDSNVPSVVNEYAPEYLTTSTVAGITNGEFEIKVI